MTRSTPTFDFRHFSVFLASAALGWGALPAPAVAADACVQRPAEVAARMPTATMLSGALPADLAARLDAAARASLQEASTPGLIVGVRTPAGTWTAAYGKADPDKDTPMQVGMNTRVGSLTKTFVGTMIMQLEETGKLSLDDRIEKYIPGVPNGGEISLRQLANMTSGVASYTRNSRFTDVYFRKPETIFKPEQLLAIGLADSPSFAPGARFDYSNTNTVLLGLVIEKVTKRPIAENLKLMVFEPLKLKSTSWPSESADLPAPYAQGFTLQGDAKDGKPLNATHWNPAWGWTAGELISNMDDLLVYGRAIGTGQGLLRPTSQVARLTSFPMPAGYGIAMGCSGGWVGHTGELPGYNSTLFYDTQTDTTVAVQTNSDIASGNCKDEPLLPTNSRNAVCSSPAVRVFVALSTALGRSFTPPPRG
jgi:D-alanyl-D-alanine carboxypeptidase